MGNNPGRKKGYTVPKKKKKAVVCVIKPTTPNCKIVLKQKIIKAKPQPVPKAEEAVNPVTFMELENHHCRWPVGDKAGFDQLYCGKEKEAKSSYCREHKARSSGGKYEF